MRESCSFFFVIFLISTISGDNTQTLIYSECSDVKYSTSTPFQYNLNSLLASLSNAAAFSLYANFTSSIASPLYPVYGLYQCRGDLSIPDCESCVNSAISQISTSLCTNAADATAQLRGCLVQYGNDSFVDKSDKSLQFKRCGQGASTGAYDPNFTGMRDDVLTGLISEQGSYRVSQAGYINGIAQCVSDQDAKNCKDCLTEAVTELKNLCEGAVSGEVYLGKCYAEYLGQGQGVNYYYSNKSPSTTNDDANEAGKDLAIIIGIVAAVLLVILFFNYLGKSAEGKGKS